MEGTAVPEAAADRRLKRALAAAALAAGAALWIYAASRLWQTTVPDNLRLPALDVHTYFSRRELDDSSSFERLLVLDGLAAQLALVAVLWLYSRHWQRFTAQSAAGRIGTGLLLGMLGFAFVWIAQLPFGLVALVWERSHGISKEDYVDYVVGSWLGLGGEFLFICVAIAIVMALAKPFRRTWWIPAAPIFTGLVLLFAFLSPYLTPDLGKLHSHDLRVAAKHLAKVEHVPDAKVSVDEVHEFTTAPNAEALGFGSTKRVVLWDTLLRRPFTEREVKPVIAHELAHLQRNHILKGVALFGLFALPLALGIALATRSRGGMYEPGAVPLALLVLVVLNIFFAPLQNAFGRRYEQEADWIGLNANRDPAAQRDALRKLATTSLSRPDPPAALQLYLDTHPSVLDRIALTRAWEERNGSR
jgi:Zn-dependent protease with chaperone function